MAAPPTASQSPLPDGSHQAGGGVSGKVHTVRTLNEPVLLHLQKAYADYAGKELTWSPEKIAAFSRDVQKDLDVETALVLSDGKPWDINAFLKYMTSSLTHAVAPVLKEDLSYPLSSYFISSSHNTYLTGNQLSSESSAEAYKNVLLRGCRCIEIDVWDGDDSDSDDDDTSSSSSSSDDEETKAKRKRRLSRVTGKLPSSLASRLEKTTLGEKKATSPPPPAAESPSTTTPPPQLKKISSAREPRVLHGYTLTKEVSFREVCLAIRDYGFVVSDTPLIVSLEVHCSPAQQETMVAIMQETWADRLLPDPKEDAAHLPSPAELAGKILVKVKYAPPTGGSASTPTGTDADAEEAVVAAAAAPAGAPAAKKPSKPSKIIQALSKLGIYTRGVTFKSLVQPEASMPTHIFSLSENGVMEVHEKSARKLFEHNRRFLMRAYPSGLRIRSSNLDPAVFWRKGIQIVALNWQNWDEGMMLNEGMFAGTSGYVLKPEGYRCTKPLPSPSSPTTTEDPQALAVRHFTMDLTITVLAAQSLPLPPGDSSASGFRPYLKVEVHVEEPGERHGTDPVPRDGREKEGEYKAKTKSRKGCNPDFKGQELRFEGIPGVVPELAFVRFLVRDDEVGRDSLAGWACVRVDRLKEGLRFMHLVDARGRRWRGRFW